MLMMFAENVRKFISGARISHCTDHSRVMRTVWFCFVLQKGLSRKR